MQQRKFLSNLVNFKPSLHQCKNCPSKNIKNPKGQFYTTFKRTILKKQNSNTNSTNNSNNILEISSNIRQSPLKNRTNQYNYAKSRQQSKKSTKLRKTPKNPSKSRQQSQKLIKLRKIPSNTFHLFLYRTRIWK